MKTGPRRNVDKGTLKRRLSIIAVVLFVVATLAITYLPKYFSKAPTWDDVYAEAGVKTTESKENLESLTISVIDVGQGDSILIHTEDTNILIDTGPEESVGNIKSTLDSYGVKELDYLIITHMHGDHTGGLDQLRKQISIKNEIIPEENSKMSGMTLTQGDIKLKFLAPIYASDNINNTSLVIKLTYKNVSALFMGDAESDEEMSILRTYSAEDLKADVIKIAHHGSEYSSSEDFLKTVNPKYAIISVGAINDYGHPHMKTLNTLQNLGIETFRTDLDGTVTLTTDGEKFTLLL